MREILIRAAVLLAATPGAFAAQVSDRSSDPGQALLDSLVAHAFVTNPRIQAARERINAARARSASAGLLPDPMLSLGVQNLPVSRDRSGTEAGRSLPEPMTMKMVGLAQTLPFPGKRGLERDAARREVESFEAGLIATQRDIVREVRAAYYELAFLDRSLEIIELHERLLGQLVRTTESRYAVGAGGQAETLKVRVEAARFAEDAVAIVESRSATLARLNALLDRASDAAIDDPRLPARIVRAAGDTSANRIRFTSAALGARAADSPLPSLAELQQAAEQNNADLSAHEAMIRAQAARLELAQRQHLPDFDVSVAYGQRNQRPDMVTAMVSVAVPWQKGRKQDSFVREASAVLAALHGEHRERVNELRARVAGLYTDVERARAQLALFVKAILPQGNATLISATAGLRVGRADFVTVLESQAMLHDYEIAYFRALTDFATSIAELEEVVGKEILP
jgi:outer membrane protein TolC